jgi:hypothetical protein
MSKASLSEIKTVFVNSHCIERRCLSFLMCRLVLGRYCKEVIVIRRLAFRRFRNINILQGLAVFESDITIVVSGEKPFLDSLRNCGSLRGVHGT